MAARAPQRWLTKDEQLAWRGFIEASQLLFEELGRRLQQDAGLSHADYEILVRLSEAEGHRLRMSELAEHTLFSRSRLSHAVGRLEDAGLVRREPCERDRRGMNAVLTDRGMKTLETAAPGHVDAVRELLFDSLSPEQVEHLTCITDALRCAVSPPASSDDPSATTPAHRPGRRRPAAPATRS